MNSYDNRLAVAITATATAVIALTCYYWRLPVEVATVKSKRKLIVSDGPREKRKTDLSALQSAASGTKTIYFDSNDTMYTEDEVKSRKFKGDLTKMVVRVPDSERKRFLEVKSKQSKERLEEFLTKIQTSKSEYYYK